eukprot:1653341-Lingulodinium_polyedra.AAC.1
MGGRHPDASVEAYHLKPTVIFTTRIQVARALGALAPPDGGWVRGAQCPGNRQHYVLEGSYKGRTLTSWAEDYPWSLARRVASG